MPLRGDGAVIEIPATGRGVTSDLAGDRAGRTPQFARWRAPRSSARIPRLFLHARQRKDCGSSAEVPMGPDVWAAFRQNSETNGFRQEQKHRLRHRLLHWRDLPRSPARTDTESHAARQAAVLARIICAAWTVRIFVFPLSSASPKLGRCDDRPNLP